MKIASNGFTLAPPTPPLPNGRSAHSAMRRCDGPKRQTHGTSTEILHVSDPPLLPLVLSFIHRIRALSFLFFCGPPRGHGDFKCVGVSYGEGSCGVLKWRRGFLKGYNAKAQREKFSETIFKRTDQKNGSLEAKSDGKGEIFQTFFTLKIFYPAGRKCM